jgi:hypothetical protein
LQDAVFVRNGIEYDAPRAADHLRLKLRRAGDRVKTAQDFIVNCATASSTSMHKYQIKFSDGHVVEAATYLRNKLNDYAAAPDPPLAGSASPLRGMAEIPDQVFRALWLPAADDRIRA